MPTHLTTQQVERYLKRAMTPVEILDAGDHLAACAECRGQVAKASMMDARFAGLRDDFKRQAREPVEHLNYERLAAYVDDHLDEVEREIVDSHLAVCASCKEELRDLFAFKETVFEDKPPTIAKEETPRAFWGRARALWSRPAVGARWGLAAATVALVLIALVAWLALRKQNDSPVVRLEQTPSPTATQSPSPQASPSITREELTPTPTPEVQPTAQPALPPIDNPERAPVLVLNDNGEQIKLDEQGKLVGLENLLPSEQQAVRNALLTGRLEAPAILKDLRGKDGTLMGDLDAEKSFKVLSPAGTVVLSSRPTFRWQALPGATSYTVKIYDTNFNVIASSDVVTSTQWAPSMPLAPDKVYTWQVVAVKDGQEVISPAPPAPDIRFRVLSAAQTEEVERSLASSRNSHLARGVIYARRGILDDAEREFEILLRENPRSSAARKLLNNVRALRRRRAN